MFFLPEILLVCLIAFLYCLFVLAKDDFVLLRKNISLEQLFSVTFLGFIVSVFFARFFYVMEHLSKRYLDPLVFFLFPYFPGLSVAGGVLGGLILLWYISSKRKFPLGRILDIVCASFFFVYPLGILLVAVADFFITKKPPILLAMNFVVFFLFSLLFFRMFLRSTFKDGSIGFIGLSLFSFVHTITILTSRGKNFLYFTPEEVVFFIGVFLFAALFIQQEKLSNFLPGGKRK